MGQNCAAKCSCISRDSELDHVTDLVFFQSNQREKLGKSARVPLSE